MEESKDLRGKERKEEGMEEQREQGGRRGAGRMRGRKSRDLLVRLFITKICKISNDDDFCCTYHLLFFDTLMISILSNLLFKKMFYLLHCIIFIYNVKLSCNYPSFHILSFFLINGEGGERVINK